MTLKDRLEVWCVLQIILWGEAMKTPNHILNKTPSKSVPLTPYELWNGEKPNLLYLRTCGCKAEPKIYNPNLRKLDPTNVSCHFVGYPDKTGGYRFYSPKFQIILLMSVEARKAVHCHSNSQWKLWIWRSSWTTPRWFGTNTASPVDTILASTLLLNGWLFYNDLIVQHIARWCSSK